MVSLHDLFTLPRKSVASFAEILPWFGLISQKMILCSDGSLLAGFTFDGADIEGIDDEDVNRRIDLLQTAFRQLTDRITIYSVQERRFQTEYPNSSFGSDVATAIDKAWGKKCTEQRNAILTHSLYIGYNFPSKSEAFFEQLHAELEKEGNALKAFGSVLRSRFIEKHAISAVRGQLQEMQEEFDHILVGFSGIVVSSLGFRRLEGDKLLGDLYSRANLASTPGPIAVPDRPAYLNTLLPADDIVRQSDMLEFRGPTRSRYCAALSTTGKPPEACSNQIDQLLGIPCEYVLVQSFAFIDRFAAQALIQAAESFYRTEVKSAAVRMFEGITGIESDKVNTGNLALSADAQEALVEVTAGDVAFGYFNMTILALGDTPNEVTRAADLISTSLRSGGYTITRERQGLMSAFLGSLPGNHKTLIRKYLATSANAADLCPIRTITRGEDRHRLFSRVLNRDVPAHVRFMTPYGVPFDFNTHAEDLGHTVVLGGSGSGKTTVMALFVSQFQKYFPCRTYIFDKDHSMGLLSVLLGGSHIDMAGERAPKINPVKRMLVDGEDRALLQWLGVLFASNDVVLTTEEQEDLSSRVQQLKSLPVNSWRLGTLYSLISGTNKRLALKIAPYVDRSDEDGSFAKGAFSDIFDNEEDTFSLGHIVCMETGKLLKTPQIAAPFMDYAFYCIERELDGQTPTLIYVEESWYMLANPIFESKVDDWLRTFRKKKGFVMFATQSPEELSRLKSWTAFVSNVPTRIFLPAINDSVAALAPIYRMLFNMNDAQLTLLTSAVPKRDYLLTKPGVTKLVQATMPRILIAINEASSNTAIREIAYQLSYTEANGWQKKFMKEYLDVQI